jgi:hypothetical protein
VRKGSKDETLVPAPRVEVTMPPRRRRIRPDEPPPPPVEAAKPPWVPWTMAVLTPLAWAARFGAQDIGLSDGEVIAEIGQIEVVLDGHCDRVAQ